MSDRDPARTESYPHLAFILNESLMAQFFLFLQQGVNIRRRVGCSVDIFLRQEIGVTPVTIEKIQSIMLDGKPVDDIRSALVHDGSVLALSAAMPGLVGATLRRGGTYSSFRSAITYHETDKACMTGEGWVRIKVFNLLMAELGPVLLQHGVIVNAADLSDHLAGRSQEFRQSARIMLDGKPIAITMLERGEIIAGKDQVFLTVTQGPAGA